MRQMRANNYARGRNGVQSLFRRIGIWCFAMSTTATETAISVPTSLREQFADRGYVILRNFIARSVIEGVREDCAVLVDRLAQRLKSQGKIAELFASEPFETRLMKLLASCEDQTPRTLRRELHLPHMFELFGHTPLLDVVEQLLGPEIRLYPNYSVRPKLPENPHTEVPWHQDAGYTEGETGELRMVNVWTPLVPPNVENGCMQFVPATHKLGPVPHHKGPIYLIIDDEWLKPRLKDAVNIEMEIGDIVLFSNLLFHVGLPNRSKHIRWSADWRYQDATQPTLRAHKGHLVRSRQHPAEVVKDAADWTSRKFQ
jgi:ectoine hydroxylase-related dioxygenase (phytanoyl-CoA dioxygenase family)